jgi:hypothetical protein
MALWPFSFFSFPGANSRIFFGSTSPVSLNTSATILGGVPRRLWAGVGNSAVGPFRTVSAGVSPALGDRQVDVRPPGSPRWIGVSWMWSSSTYVAMVRLSPAVFSVPGAAVALHVMVAFGVIADYVVIADYWVLSDSEPLPTRTRLKARAVIATSLIALALFIKYSRITPAGRLVRLPSRRAA